jgi:membrane-associated protein
MFESLLAPFLSFVLLYKYVGLFLIALTGAFAIPIPASATLAAAGAFASQGYFNFYGIMLTALAGNLTGDWVGFLLARQYGETALKKIGLGRVLRSSKFETLRGYIHTFPEALIYFSRFLTEMGPTVNVLSGLSQVSIKKFLIFDILGEMSYVLLYASIGYFLGTQWENNASFLLKVVFVMLSIGVVVNLIQVYIFRKKYHGRVK